MTIIDPPNDAELAAYVSGNAPADRARAIDAWAAHHADNAARIASIRLLLASDSSAPKWDHDRMWAKVLTAVGDERARAGGADAAAPAPVRPPVRAPTIAAQERGWKFTSRLGAVAAAALVLAAALYGGLGERALRAFGSDHDYVTRRGEQAAIQLDDGTRITLAPESRLRIRAAYGHPDRAVELEGEAAFEVVHDAAHQFSVHAGRAMLTDIGTRFDLRAYGTDSIVRVAVAEGEVMLDAYRAGTMAADRSASSNGLRVPRGALARLDVDGSLRSSSIANAADYFAWTTGRLVFDRQPLRDVLATIARWSDADLRVSDASLGAELVTAAFPAQSGQNGQSGAAMAQALAQAVGASVERSGNTFTLVRR
jgi:transmembrane sensor